MYGGDTQAVVYGGDTIKFSGRLRRPKYDQKRSKIAFFASSGERPEIPGEIRRPGFFFVEKTKHHFLRKTSWGKDLENLFFEPSAQNQKHLESLFLHVACGVDTAVLTKTFGSALSKNFHVRNGKTR